MWLVLPYYHNGDLQQFLKRNVIDLEKMIRISHSICLAVDFIHSETDSFGCQRLPLAHRDIKVRISLKQVLAKLTKHIYIFHIIFTYFTIYCTGNVKGTILFLKKYELGFVGIKKTRTEKQVFFLNTLAFTRKFL